MTARIIFAVRIVFRAVLSLALIHLQTAPLAAQTGGDLEPPPRLALVIGNSGYENLAPVDKAGPDSELVAETLRNLGFEVIELPNLSKKGMEEAVLKAAQAAPLQEAVLFYFAGHAFQLEGSNFLAPVDARLTSRQRLRDETVKFSDIVDKLRGEGRQSLFFLEAGGPVPVPAGAGKVAQGLAEAEAEAVRGTFVAFAAQPGAVPVLAEDSASPFSLALAEHMATDGISISDMMFRVRNAVEEQTGLSQTPWDRSLLRAQFYFSPQVESSDSLTEEDLELLTVMDPALRKVFQKKFGLDLLDSATPVIANVRPGLVLLDEEPTENEAEEASANELATAADAEAADLGAVAPGPRHFGRGGAGAAVRAAGNCTRSRNRA